jgi:hypothetical protein
MKPNDIRIEARAIQIALQSGEALHAPTEAVERLAGLVAALADHLDIIERRTLGGMSDVAAERVLPPAPVLPIDASPEDAAVRRRLDARTSGRAGPGSRP